jgi:hypothetical protein
MDKDNKICQKKDKTQTAGRQAAIDDAASFTQILFGMVLKMLPDNDERFYSYCLLA